MAGLVLGIDHSRGRNQSYFFILAGILSIFALHGFFFPKIYAFCDESDYLALTTVIGRWFSRLPIQDIPLRSLVETGAGQKVSDYLPGMPLLLFPWALAGWRAVFLANLFFHFAGTLIFIKLLKHFGIRDSFWALLYLFHPSFVLFSRTLMSDIPAAVFFLAGALLFFQKRSFFAGMFWGASLFIRESMFIFFLPLVLLSVWRARDTEGRLGLGRLVLGLFPFFVCLAAYRARVFGDMFLHFESLAGGAIAFFSASYFPRHISHYLAHLMIVYPGMLAVFIFSRYVKKPEFILPVFSALIFFSFYFFYDQFSDGPSTVIFGARFLFPAVPFLLIPFAGFLESRTASWGKATARIFKCCLLILFVLSAAFIHDRHQKALRPQLEMKNLIYNNTAEGSTLFYDENSAELMQRVWGSRRYIRVSEDTWQELLMSADWKKPVYLAVRDHHYADEIMPGLKSQVNMIEGKYPMELIDEAHELRLYEITRAE